MRLARKVLVVAWIAGLSLLPGWLAPPAAAG
jgi:hypothetical protein